MNLTEIQKKAFYRWRSCRFSGDFVSFEVYPKGDGTETQIRQRGYCMDKKITVDFLTDCLHLGECHRPRRPVKHKATPTARARRSLAMKRHYEKKTRARVRAPMNHSRMYDLGVIVAVIPVIPILGAYILFKAIRKVISVGVLVASKPLFVARIPPRGAIK